MCSGACNIYLCPNCLRFNGGLVSHALVKHLVRRTSPSSWVGYILFTTATLEKSGTGLAGLGRWTVTDVHMP